MPENVKLSVCALNTLRICAEIEEECANIYWYFSGLFKHDRQAQALWHRTAREEENHAAQFKLAVNLKGAGMSLITMNEDKARSMLCKIRLIHDCVRSRPPSLTDALLIAKKADEALSKIHLSNLIDFSDKHLKKLFALMTINDREHIRGKDPDDFWQACPDARFDVVIEKLDLSRQAACLRNKGEVMN